MSSISAEFVESPSCCGLFQDFSPAADFKQDDIDEILAQGMKNLTFDELQREQEDLHGVGELLDKDNNQEVLSMLKSFDDHLDRRKKSTVYASAEAMDKTYVSNTDLRILFLHGNRYDPKTAAEQFIKFFEVKMQLFGKEKLVKDITIDDLDEDDRENLRGGSLQILRMTDRTGRKIILELPGLRAFKSLRNELRARFYMLVNLLPHAKRGVVWISYCVAQYHDKMNGAGFVETTQMCLAIPIHWASLHLGTDDATECMIAKAAICLTPWTLRAKTRIHFGSHYEVQYKFQTYGISRSALPFAIMNNDPILDDHLTWYKQLVDPSTKCPLNCIEPNPHDVLFAGRRFSGNGNENLRLMAMCQVQTYTEGNRKDRLQIVDNMVEQIRSNGGRFLKLDGDGSSWMEVSMPEVHEKINQMFRNLRRPRASQQPKPTIPTNHLPLLCEHELSPNDVLFGKKLGNQRLKQLVENMAAHYDAATRGKKKQLVDSLVEQIKACNGRFLRQVEGGKWQQISDDTVIFTKVSSHFRNYRRYNKQKQ